MTPPSDITIRPAYADDQVALRRLAALDSATVPPGPLLLAEVGGELRAAISLRDGRSIADPFERTVELVELLELRLAQRTPGAPANWSSLSACGPWGRAISLVSIGSKRSRAAAGWDWSTARGSAAPSGSSH